MSNYQIYKNWEESVESKYEIVGDFVDHDSLIFLFGKESYAQIGYNECDDSFFMVINIEGEEEPQLMMGEGDLFFKSAMSYIENDLIF